LCVFRCRFRTTVAAALERPRRILASSGVAVARVLINFAHCRKRSDSEYLFLNRKRKPNQHLLPDLQDLAKKAGAKFHTELHKLRKTGASRRYLNGVPLPTLMLELGHESLATTQDYLADVRREDEAKKAVADADFVPKPRLVSGTDGD